MSLEGTRQIQREAELCGFKAGTIFPHTWQAPPFLCWALPPHGHTLTCSILMNSTSSTTRILSETPPYHKGPQPLSRWQLHSYSEKFADCPQIKHWHKVWICINLVNTTYLSCWLPKNLPHRTCIPPKTLSVAELNSSLLLTCLRPGTSGTSPYKQLGYNHVYWGPA